MIADQIGIALKGRRNGSGWLVSCPCPNHGKGRGDRFPSLSVADGDDDRLLLRCFAGCEFVDILDELKHRGLVDGAQPAPTKYQFTPSIHRFVETNPDVGSLTIWKATVEPQETVVDEYLNRRGIYLRPPMLRCRLDHRSMVVAVQAPDGKVIAIQQTWLTREGGKASPKRLTTGNLGAGAVRLGATARAAAAQPGEPPWPKEGRERPLILVSLSSLNQGQAPILHRVLLALARLDVRAIVTVGPSLNSSEFVAPSNVQLEQFVPHSAVLPHVDALVTQCGIGTLTKGLLTGVPLVCLPIVGDQPDNAARVSAHGAGIQLPTDASPEQIGAAIEHVLVDPRFKEAALRLRASMHNEGNPVDRAIAAIEGAF